MSSHSALEDAFSLLFAENVRAEVVRERSLTVASMMFMMQSLQQLTLYRR